jgi:hypothetical protein
MVSDVIVRYRFFLFLVTVAWRDCRWFAVLRLDMSMLTKQPRTA